MADDGKEAAAGLNLTAANSIIEHALVKARDSGTAALTIVVVDAAGNVIASQRQDGASMFRFDVALGKAWAATAMGVSSRALAKRATDNPNFFVALAATANGKFLAQPGAAIIRDSNGAIVGAAGASGATGDEDEACCVYGIQHAGFQADAAE